MGAPFRPQRGASSQGRIQGGGAKGAAAPPLRSERRPSEDGMPSSKNFGSPPRCDNLPPSGEKCALRAAKCRPLRLSPPPTKILDPLLVMDHSSSGGGGSRPTTPLPRHAYQVICKYEVKVLTRALTGGGGYPAPSFVFFTDSLKIKLPDFPSPPPGSACQVRIQPHG